MRPGTIPEESQLTVRWSSGAAHHPRLPPRKCRCSLLRARPERSVFRLETSGARQRDRRNWLVAPGFVRHCHKPKPHYRPFDLKRKLFSCRPENILANHHHGLKRSAWLGLHSCQSHWVQAPARYWYLPYPERKQDNHPGEKSPVVVRPHPRLGSPRDSLSAIASCFPTGDQSTDRRSAELSSFRSVPPSAGMVVEIADALRRGLINRYEHGASR